MSREGCLVVGIIPLESYADYGKVAQTLAKIGYCFIMMDTSGDSADTGGQLRATFELQSFGDCALLSNELGKIGLRISCYENGKLNDLALTSSSPANCEPPAKQKKLTGPDAPVPQSRLLNGFSLQQKSAISDSATNSEQVRPRVSEHVSVSPVANSPCKTLLPPSAHSAVENGAMSMNNTAATSDLYSPAGTSTCSGEVNGNATVSTAEHVPIKIEPLLDPGGLGSPHSRHDSSLEEAYYTVNSSAEESDGNLANIEPGHSDWLTSPKRITRYGSTCSGTPKTPKNVASVSADVGSKSQSSQSEKDKQTQKRNTGSKVTKTRCMFCGVVLQKPGIFSYLLKHVQTHCRHRYHCKACAYTAPRIDSMWKHVTSMHQNDDVDECNDTADMDLVVEWKQRFQECFPGCFPVYETRFGDELIEIAPVS